MDGKRRAGAMLDEIRDDLDGLGVRFDRWTSEREFTASGAIDRALEQPWPAAEEGLKNVFMTTAGEGH